jgi:tetratricopeptide (TPR) repeat protein
MTVVEGSTTRRAWPAVLVVAVATAVACGRDSSGGKAMTQADGAVPAAAPDGTGGSSSLSAPSGHANLRAVAVPDLSKMAPSVQKQLRDQVAVLRTKIAQRGAPAAELAGEYGRMGMLFMASEQRDSAELCFQNAQTLVPADARWPYYLGQLYRIRGPMTSAVASFEQALKLRPDDVAAMVFLGEAYLSEGRTDDADPLFNRALVSQPKLVPALFGIGRVQLARKQYAEAAKTMEECLVLDPRGTAVHYPLAMAYRGLGNNPLADAHIKLQGEVKIQPLDPLMAELDQLLESPRAYDLRGGQLLETGDWAGAVQQFRKGLELDPASAALRLRLGTAMFQMGDASGARAQFEQVLKDSPNYARAHYSLGVLAAAAGRSDEAMQRFAAAVSFGPDDASSRVGYGGVLRQAGKLKEALAQYEEAGKLDGRRPDAVLGSAEILGAMNRYGEARDRLLQANRAYPEEPEYAHALARLFAAAPDAKVRNGRRAMALVQQLLQGRQSSELGETLAMALAEVGDFDSAVKVQRDVMQAVQQAGGSASPSLAANLKLYQEKKPCRTPWPAAS